MGKMETKFSYLELANLTDDQAKEMKETEKSDLKKSKM